jgi:hypothetical protein
VSPLVAEDSTSANVQGEPEVHVVPLPLTAAYKAADAGEPIPVSPTSAPAMAAMTTTPAVLSLRPARGRSRDLVGDPGDFVDLVMCPLARRLPPRAPAVDLMAHNRNAGLSL